MCTWGLWGVQKIQIQGLEEYKQRTVHIGAKFDKFLSSLSFEFSTQPSVEKLYSSDL